MLSWFEANLGSILVALTLVAVSALIVRGLIRDKKRGRHLCGGNCGGCPGNCAACGGHCADCAGKPAVRTAER